MGANDLVEKRLLFSGVFASFWIQPSYRNRKLADGASGARLPTNLSKKCFSPKNIF